MPGDIWNYFDCDGTPWIAVVQDGIMVWENYYNNPESFPYEIMDQLVAAGSG